MAKQNEMYFKIPGSYEETVEKIRSALRASGDFGSVENEWDLSVEATFSDYVIVRKSIKNGDEYYKANWSIDDNGAVKFSEVKGIKVDAVIKIKNEGKDLQKPLDESFDISLQSGNIILTETVKDGKRVTKGRVNEAQKGDELNQNNRIYKSDILQSAFNEAKESLKANGPMLMYSGHKLDNGKNYDGLEGVVAVIKDIEWDDTAKAIHLNEIEFPETPTGREHIALLEAGVKLQVSQRGEGVSHFEKLNGKLIEIVDKVHFKGWDFLPAGRASVTSANFTLTEKEGDITDMAKITLDEEKLEELVNKKLDERLQAQTKVLNEQEQKPAEPQPEVKPEVKDVNEEKITTIQSNLNETNERLRYFETKEQKAQLREVGTKAIVEALAGDDYKRFTNEHKKALTESVDIESLFGKVDITKEDDIKAKALELLKNEIAKIDKFIAVAKLTEMGYPKAGTGNGITDVQVVNENIPGMELISRFTKDVNTYMDRADNWKLPDDHTAMETMKKILEKYDHDNYPLLVEAANKKNLLESGEQVTQSDIAIKNAVISRVFISSVWPRLTALEICETGTMVTRQDLIPVETFLPAFSTDVHTDMLLLQPGESQSLNVAGITLSFYPIQATPKNQSTYITSEAIATAKGLNINLIGRTVALLGNYVRTILDRSIYELIIAKAQAYATTEVSSWTALTRVGSTNEYYGEQGWVKFEYVKTLDGNGNPTLNKLIPLFGTTSTNTLTAVQAREGGGDNTALTYGDDYTINWPDGSLTLTTAGAAKAGANGVEAKYTYTTNAKFWSIVPDSGVTLYSHLLNLSQKFGEAKVMVEDRYYDTDFVAMNLSNADLIGRGPQFTQSGYTQGNVKDAMAVVQTYDGKPVKKSTNIPRGWVIVGKTGGVVYYVQTPWSVEGPLAIDNTRNRYWQVEEYSAIDVPVNDKFALVGITDLASV